ncbi:hypothetical protein BU55_05145 [Escherichia coli O146:H21 str. 2010C-3325]|nr:hypothetical protein BU55_05145 [Escherichia coli O146:H21 str. 2010C-3325]
MRAWISGKVRFVYAGCGTSALSGLQNRANSKYCRGRVDTDKRSASGNVAFVISLSPLFSGLHCF